MLCVVSWLVLYFLKMMVLVIDLLLVCFEKMFVFNVCRSSRFLFCFLIFFRFYSLLILWFVVLVLVLVVEVYIFDLFVFLD